MLRGETRVSVFMSCYIALHASATKQSYSVFTLVGVQSASQIKFRHWCVVTGLCIGPAVKEG